MAKKAAKTLAPKANILLDSAGMKMEDKPIAINKWDIAAVKNLMDDAVYKYAMEFSEGFEEDFRETDIRLLVCLAACLFAGFACIWGFIVPHPKSTPVVSVCVIGYFTLVFLLSVYQTLFEVPTLVTAKKVNEGGKPDELTVITNMERYDTTYKVCVTYVRGATGEKMKREEDWDIGNYFFEDGVLAIDCVDEDITQLCKNCVSKKST